MMQTIGPARRSLIAFVTVVALAVGLFAAAAPASASGPPFGQVTNSYSGGLYGYAEGWAADPDALWTPIDVRAAATYYNFACSKLGCSLQPVDWYSWTQTANHYDATMLSDRAYALLFGPWHGFDIHLVKPNEAISAGGLGYAAATVCVTALNVGLGGDTSLGCFDFEPELT